MKYYKEFAVENDDDYKTAKEIAEIYNITSYTRFGGGPKVAANIKKYIDIFNINYEKIYKEEGGHVTLVYPKKIYDIAMKLYKNEVIVDMLRKKYS